MRVQVLTIFPELFGPFLATSLVGRAIEKGILDVQVHDLRAFTEDRHRSVDDEPYGGGGGMVMTAQPWMRAVRALSGVEGETKPWRVLLSPQGARLDDAKVRELADRGDLLLMCGRYEGIDERVRMTVVDEEVSIGDYVLSGGELPAMVLIEAMSRQVPGVVKLADRWRRTASAPACSTTRTTRGRRWWKGWRCRRCCSPATMRRSAAGASGRRSGRPGKSGRTCCGEEVKVARGPVERRER